MEDELSWKRNSIYFPTTHRFFFRRCAMNIKRTKLINFCDKSSSLEKKHILPIIMESNFSPGRFQPDQSSCFREIWCQSFEIMRFSVFWAAETVDTAAKQYESSILFRWCFRLKYATKMQLLPVMRESWRKMRFSCDFWVLFRRMLCNTGESGEEAQSKK